MLRQFTGSSVVLSDNAQLCRRLLEFIDRRSAAGQYLRRFEEDISLIIVANEQCRARTFRRDGHGRMGSSRGSARGRVCLAAVGRSVHRPSTRPADRSWEARARAASP